MASVFSRIVAGEIPSYKIDEDEFHFAFLDINPVANGHVLVIPKKEIDNIFDIEDQEFQSLWIFAKNIAEGIQKSIPCLKVGISVIGLEVPHAHIHLVPINSIGDINFSKTKLTPSKEELEKVQKLIISNIPGTI